MSNFLICYRNPSSLRQAFAADITDKSYKSLLSEFTTTKCKLLSDKAVHKLSRSEIKIKNVLWEKTKRQQMVTTGWAQMGGEKQCKCPEKKSGV